MCLSGISDGTCKVEGVRDKSESWSRELTAATVPPLLFFFLGNENDGRKITMTTAEKVHMDHYRYVEKEQKQRLKGPSGVCHSKENIGRRMCRKAAIIILCYELSGQPE